MPEPTTSARTYFMTAGALMGLLVLTVAAYFLNVSPTLSILIAMTIAGTKALVIMLYFMHVRYSSRLVQLISGGAFLWLLLLFMLTLSDYLTRAG